MGKPLRVSVVAPDPLLEAGAASILRGCPDLAVVLPGEAAQVTVVIVDELTRQALDVVRAVKNAPDGPEVVLVAADLALPGALHAIVAGARGLLRRREAGAASLARAVQAAAGGDCILPPDMLGRMLDQGSGGSPAATRPAHAGPDPGVGGGLSDREQAVLKLIAAGLDTREIARELCYSTRTVAGIVQDVTRRFRLRNRAHAVAYALRTGLL
jgi:DNA-binding NarL/FixJ family response regulator